MIKAIYKPIYYFSINLLNFNELTLKNTIYSLKIIKINHKPHQLNAFI